MLIKQSVGNVCYLYRSLTELSLECFGGEVLLTGYLASHSIMARADLPSLPACSSSSLALLFSAPTIRGGHRRKSHYCGAKDKQRGEEGSATTQPDARACCCYYCKMLRLPTLENRAESAWRGSQGRPDPSPGQGPPERWARQAQGRPPGPEPRQLQVAPLVGFSVDGPSKLLCSPWLLVTLYRLQNLNAPPPANLRGLNINATKAKGYLRKRIAGIRA